MMVLYYRNGISRNSRNLLTKLIFATLDDFSHFATPALAVRDLAAASTPPEGAPVRQPMMSAGLCAGMCAAVKVFAAAVIWQRHDVRGVAREPGATSMTEVSHPELA